MSIQVHLEQFEGPLALLLFLIRKNEMDIYDIQIHKITEQYLEHIQIMKDVDMEGAGEFVSMAATLIHIKSKMLLPQYDEAGNVVEEEDPRKDLVQRLVEYQKFQEATKWFKDRPQLGRDVWRRGFREMWSDGDSTIILDEGGLFAMIGLYRRVLNRIKDNVHVVMEKTQSLASRILELKDYFIPGQSIHFTDLMGTKPETKTKWVVTFLSILELGRLGFVSIFQNELHGTIHITTKKPIERDVVTQVDEFNYQNTAVVPSVQGVGPVLSEPLVLTATDEEIELAERNLSL